MLLIWRRRLRCSGAQQCTHSFVMNRNFVEWILDEDELWHSESHTHMLDLASGMKLAVPNAIAANRNCSGSHSNTKKTVYFCCACNFTWFTSGIWFALVKPSFVADKTKILQIRLRIKWWIESIANDKQQFAFCDLAVKAISVVTSPPLQSDCDRTSVLSLCFVDAEYISCKLTGKTDKIQPAMDNGPYRNCYICYRQTTDRFPMLTKLKYSKSLLFLLVNQFLDTDQKYRFNRDEIVCAKCMFTLNRYDLASLTAKRIEQEIKDAIIVTDQTYRQGNVDLLDPNDDVSSSQCESEFNAWVQPSDRLLFFNYICI